MKNILDFLTKEILENDIDNSYKKTLSVLSSKYTRLHSFKLASKLEVEDELLEATNVLITAALQADTLYKQADFEKDAGFITNIILKTLKVAQKVLAGLLIKNPLKIGIAYNAMHNVIKFLEREMKKKK